MRNKSIWIWLVLISVLCICIGIISSDMLYSSEAKNYPSQELASPDSNNIKVKVEVGETFEISIEQALHPDYDWILKSYDPEYVKFIGEHYKAPPSGIIGTTIKVFEFKALKQGITEIVLAYDDETAKYTVQILPSSPSIEVNAERSTNVGENVTISIVNTGKETLEGTPYFEIRDCEGDLVFAPVVDVAQVIIELAPYEKYKFIWEQENNEGEQVPLSYYIVRGFFANSDDTILIHIKPGAIGFAVWTDFPEYSIGENIEVHVTNIGYETLREDLTCKIFDENITCVDQLLIFLGWNPLRPYDTISYSWSTYEAGKYVVKVSGGGFVDTTEIAIGVIDLSSKPVYEVGEELNVTIINNGDGYLYLRACGYHSIYNSDAKEYLCKSPYSRTAGYQKLEPGEFTKVGHHYAPSNISELGNYTVDVVGYYSEEDFGSFTWLNLNDKRIHQVNASITIKVVQT